MGLGFTAVSELISSVSSRSTPLTSPVTIRVMMMLGTRTASRRWVELEVTRRLAGPDLTSFGLGVAAFIKRKLSHVLGAPWTSGTAPVPGTSCSLSVGVMGHVNK